MGFEAPKMPSSDELAEKQKERIKSDAELVEGGAEVTSEGKINPTEEQKNDAKIEMGEHFYKKSKELEKDKRNLEIYEEIRKNKFDNSNELTSITPEIAERLSHSIQTLDLKGLTSISDEVAEHLSNQEEGWLDLRGLNSISDETAKHLAKHREKVFVKEELREKIEKFKQNN